MQHMLQRGIADPPEPATVEPGPTRAGRLAMMIRSLRKYAPMGSLLTDLRHAYRSLRRAPVFTLAAVLTLGLGIGLNAAVFSAVYGIVLRPLDLPQPERLVTLWQNNEARGGKRQEPTGWALAAAWRARNRCFSAMAGVSGFSADLAGGDPPQNVEGARVSRDFFPMLGVKPALGRAFLPEDEVKGRDAVAILAHGLWRRAFGGDRSLVGRAILVNGLPRTVVGILPEGFRSPVRPQAELWVPMWFQPPPEDWGSSYISAVGRLAPGVSLRAAQAEMDRVAAALAADDPARLRGIGVALEPLLDTIVGATKKPLLLLLGAVSLLLLIACFNVANLFLSRAVARQPELALRLALGARRGRLARLFVGESLWLAAGAAACGLVFGSVYLALLRGLAPPQTPRLDSVRLDGTVVAVTFAVALATSLVSGLLPAAWVSRRRPFEVLRAATGASASRPALRLRGALVTAEIAGSIMLLLGAGILLRSLAALGRVDPGFRTERMVLGHLTVMPGHPPDLHDVVDFADRLEERLAQRPEIAAVGIISAQPLAERGARMGFALDGQGVAAEQRQAAEFRLISPGYCRAFGLPLAAGRFFAASDTGAAPPVALVNERFARLFLGGAAPLGHRLRSDESEGEQAPWRRIVGVVGDLRGQTLDRPPDPEIYIPFAQQPGIYLTVAARAAASSAAALAAIRETVKEIRPGQVVARPETMADVLDRGLSPRRFTAGLVASFAVVALLLAAVGIYGVTALAVSQRQGELAVRMALGAEPAMIAAMVLRWSGLLLAGGVVVGIAGALATRRLVSGLLYGVGPMDAVAVAAAIAFLAVVALAATLLPALRASRMDAARVLRSET
jgi:putative ABC transport system permease protein